MQFPDMGELHCLFNKYVDQFFPGNNPISRHAATEVAVRLNQLGMLQTRMRDLIAHSRSPMDLSPEARQHDISLFFEVRTLCEAYYYLAFRIMQLVRSGKFKYLKNFEAIGIRNVRNHLIEHPEKTQAPYQVQSFAFTHADGPILKFVRADSDVELYADKGLYFNSNEFAENLTACLRRALAQPRDL